MIADVPTQKALSLPVGTRVAAVLPAEGARLLTLKEDRARNSRRASSGRSVKMPADAGGGEVAHAALVVHRVDERNEPEPLRGANAARRDARVVKACRPRVARGADRDGEADVLHRAQAGAERARLLERRALEADERVGVRQEANRARDDVVAAVAARGLQLDHDADASAHQIERLLEGRVVTAGARRLVRDDEPSLGVGVHVELDIVGADLDRALERGQRVLGQLGRGAAMRYDKHRRISSTSMRSTSSSASRSRSRVERPELRDHAQPGGLRGRDARLGVLEDERIGRIAEQPERLQVALRVGLAAHDVVGGDDRPKAARRGRPPRRPARSPPERRRSRSRAARARRRSARPRARARGSRSRRRPRRGSAARARRSPRRRRDGPRRATSARSPDRRGRRARRSTPAPTAASHARRRAR